MIKATPIQLFFEILFLGPLGFARAIFGEKRFRLLNHDEVTKALKSQYSLLRWADGETAIARGKSIGYQEKDADLAVRLKNALNKPRETVLIGIPPANFESLFNGRWSLLRLKIMFSTRVFLSKYISLRSESLYCSTFYWYQAYSNLSNLLIDIKQNRPSLLVAGNPDCLKACPVGTDYIQTPMMNAYSDQVSIETEIDHWINLSKLKFAENKPLILLACGPYSKALVDKYADVAQMVDVGHGFNFFLAGKAKYAWE
jgi:hypothetical protein